MWIFPPKATLISSLPWSFSNIIPQIQSWHLVLRFFQVMTLPSLWLLLLVKWQSCLSSTYLPGHTFSSRGTTNGVVPQQLWANYLAVWWHLLVDATGFHIFLYIRRILPYHCGTGTIETSFLLKMDINSSGRNGFPPESSKRTLCQISSRMKAVVKCF